MRDRADFALPETLRTIPGFRVQQLGGFGTTANVKTRGLRNQDTAVLIDGIRFRDASAITGDASTFLSDFTLTSVSRIEVLRGSGSSLYGTNAIGGTIDFQTLKPTSGLQGQIGGAFGGYDLGRFRGNLSDGTTDGKFGFNLGVSRTVYAKGIDGEHVLRDVSFAESFRRARRAGFKAGKNDRFRRRRRAKSFRQSRTADGGLSLHEIARHYRVAANCRYPIRSEESTVCQAAITSTRKATSRAAASSAHESEQQIRPTFSRPTRSSTATSAPRKSRVAESFKLWEFRNINSRSRRRRDSSARGLISIFWRRAII
jgi:outer membrane receptor protein involved in Fe transport